MAPRSFWREGPEKSGPFLRFVWRLQMLMMLQLLLGALDSPEKRVRDR